MKHLIMSASFIRIPAWQKTRTLIKGSRTLICFLVLVFMPMFDCGSWAAPVGQPRGLDEIVAVIPVDAPPTYYRNQETGEADGFAVDLANEIAKRAGSPEYQRVYSKWYGKPGPYFAVTKQNLGIVIVMCIVVIAIASWRHLSVMSLTRQLREEIRERERTEGTLKQSESNLKRAERIAKVGNWEWNIPANELIWSEEVYRLYGVDPLKQKPSYDVVVKTLAPECRDRFVAAVNDALTLGKHFEGEYRMISLRGTEHYTHTVGEVLRDREGRPLSMFGVVQDITERKLAEEEVSRSLREKEVLLKEIHHRVKNNMQVITSLLNLQAKGVADKTVRALFEESRDRVKSMSLIHEKLYRSADLAHIDFKEYLKSLVRGIADTYKRHDVVITVDMKNNVALDVNVGIPCGLIVNELVSNSLKHAFPKARKGRITVGLDKNADGNYVLNVVDNGIGFPADKDFRSTASLGLQLVNVLTGQIHGKIELSDADGARFSIIFPEAEEDKGGQHG